VRYDVVVTNAQLVLPQDTVRFGAVGIRDGKIAALAEPDALTPDDGLRSIDAGGAFVLPGAIDPHVHIGYKGHQGMPLDELPRQFLAESHGAAIGGVTTMMITFRSGDPYTGMFDEMRAAGEENSLVDFGYSLGITNMGHVEQLRRYRDELGVTSFKFYMAYRGTDAQASGNTYNEFNDGLFVRAAGVISQLDGAMAMVHAENPDIIAMERQRLMAAGAEGLAVWSESRPDIAEAEAIMRAIGLASSQGCRLYVPHVSSRAGLEAAQLGRRAFGADVTLETCPHYLTHTADSPVGPLAKVNPPLRGADDVASLWEAIRAGDVQTIGTDHCATSVADKGGSIWDSVPGFPGMATMAPVVLTGAFEGRFSVGRAAQVLAENSARAFGLYPAKGAIEIGADADLMVVDPTKRRRVEHEALGSLSDFSIYEGQELAGWPDYTISRGRVLVDGGCLVDTTSRGSYLAR
jgi:dihydropyrimidinase